MSRPSGAAAVAALWLAAGSVAVAAGTGDIALYDLSVGPLTDQSGREISLDLHRGHPTIVTMFYATCPHACPALIADLRRIDAALTDATRGRTRFLLVSLDSGGDSPEVMKELAALHGLDPLRWTLARPGSEMSVRLLAAALGVKYRRLPDGSFNHTSLVTVLDGEGVVRHQVEGLGLSHEDTVAALEKAAAAIASRRERTGAPGGS